MPKIFHSREKWNAVRADYEIAAMSLERLAKKHGIALSTISVRANKEGWVKGKSLPVKQQLSEGIETYTKVELQAFGQELQQMIRVKTKLATAREKITDRIIECADKLQVEGNDSAHQVIKGLSSAVKDLDDRPPQQQVNVQNNVSQSTSTSVDDIEARIRRQLES